MSGLSVHLTIQGGLSREDLTVFIVVRCDRRGGTLFRLSCFRCRGCGSAQSPPPAEEKGPPLPFITIEGAGGGAITPMAYLVNPAGECDVWGKPSVAFDYIGLGRKNLDTLLVTENLLGRIEFGFAADRLGLGTLPYDINRTVATDPQTCRQQQRRVAVQLQRPRPGGEGERRRQSMAAGRHAGRDLKYNADINNINQKLGGALARSATPTTRASTLRSRPPRPWARRFSASR